MFLSADILVPAGRFGAKIQESDLLHAGVHHAAVFMCQPLLPWCQVKDEDRKEEHGLDGQKHSEGLQEERKNKLIALTWLRILGPKPVTLNGSSGRKTPTAVRSRDVAV